MPSGLGAPERDRLGGTDTSNGRFTFHTFQSPEVNRRRRLATLRWLRGQAPPLSRVDAGCRARGGGESHPPLRQYGGENHPSNLNATAGGASSHSGKKSVTFEDALAATNTPHPDGYTVGEGALVCARKAHAAAVCLAAALERATNFGAGVDQVVRSLRKSGACSATGNAAHALLGASHRRLPAPHRLAASLEREIARVTERCQQLQRFLHHLENRCLDTIDTADVRAELDASINASVEEAVDALQNDIRGMQRERDGLLTELTKAEAQCGRAAAAAISSRRRVGREAIQVVADMADDYRAVCGSEAMLPDLHLLREAAVAAPDVSVDVRMATAPVQRLFEHMQQLLANAQAPRASPTASSASPPSDDNEEYPDDAAEERRATLRLVRSAHRRLREQVHHLQTALEGYTTGESEGEAAWRQRLQDELQQQYDAARTRCAELEAARRHADEQRLLAEERASVALEILLLGGAPHITANTAGYTERHRLLAMELLSSQLALSEDGSLRIAGDEDEQEALGLLAACQLVHRREGGAYFILEPPEAPSGGRAPTP
ncbi:hypothetical protein CDCA_CDCA04G1401 [Cyanidium caldarium]|uniref:Uncharacterized protein n=1 Tax=Cyanidium caldarium TaxID=2771 RepID=A0AAV9ITI1_CYACA|nr:hypothetical protein CDCA_CDCA04G1401 [Cyanidium caldarium]